VALLLLCNVPSVTNATSAITLLTAVLCWRRAAGRQGGPIMTEIEELTKLRFDALAGYARKPAIGLYVEEIEWHATCGERLVGMVTYDRIDHDFGWIVLGRDERLRFRATDVNASLASVEAAREELFDRLRERHAQPDEAYHQKDAPGAPTDFYTPLVSHDRLHPTFKILITQKRYSPAYKLIEAMMRFYEDVDGNFVEQFQTRAFDARIWELYLFAAFFELGSAPIGESAIPDFLFSGLLGSIAVEATSMNPPIHGEVPLPDDKEELTRYIENYIPAKIARVLKRKLQHKKPYWEKPELENTPFVIAVQDFHSPGAMRMITSTMTEYLFGVRHSLEDGRRKIERIEKHVWGDVSEKSGFFTFERAENISAVIVNAQGTLPKFNRMGYLAGFGNRNVHMVRTGWARGEMNLENPMPIPFQHNVHDPAYTETWVEGILVLHNPTARIPLDPDMIPGASHEFLQPDGSIMSIVPAFHPLFSMTAITVAE
jgi:hypothetical protein